MDKNKKTNDEVSEETTSASSGSYVTGGSLFMNNKKRLRKGKKYPKYNISETSVKITKNDIFNFMAKKYLTEDESVPSPGDSGQYSQPKIWAKDIAKSFFSKKPWWNGGSFVKLDPRCTDFNNKEYCDQGAVGGAVKLSKGRNKKKITESIANKTGKSKKYVEMMIDAYLFKKNTNE